jgi:prepilin-type N-terminal cleavage/methylation domain-containing protein
VHFFLTPNDSPAPGRVRLRRASRAGFSLIELLIVVAIISILAAIAVPNFIEAQTRAKVARVQADMRSLTTAIVAYTVDNNSVPVRRTEFGDAGLGIGTNSTAYWVCYQNRARQIGGSLGATDVNDRRAGVTTPIAYITTVPVDPFDTSTAYPNNTIDYGDDVQTARFINLARFGSGGISTQGFALLSIGPDGTFGHTIGLYGSFCPAPYPLESVEERRSCFDFYDPTNGTTSLGNIYRLEGHRNDQSTFSP